MLDWLLVGGGIHGCHLALVLRACGVPEGKVRVLDPHEELLSQWESRTRRTGMMFLRSPGVHHLGLGAHDLFRWAAQRRSLPGGVPPFRGKNRRPQLALFNAHAREVMGRAGVPGLHLQGWFQTLSPSSKGFRVECSSGVLEARRVVLALGGGTPGLPPWAREVAGKGGSVAHLFDPEVSPAAMGRAAQAAGLPVGVVGGGISAAQVALSLASSGIPTRLFLRHPWRVHRFDADPGWLGPLRLQGFHREADPRVRSEMIRVARHRGSVTEEEARRIRVMERRGCLQVVRGQVVGLAGLPGGDPRCGMELLIRAEPDPGEADSSEDRLAAPRGAVARHPLGALILATGLDHRPGSGDRWTTLARELGLPTLADGTPLPGPDLGWNRAPSNHGTATRVASDSGLYVTGRLAELELGPVAGNVAGARMAAMRLAAVAQEGR